MGVALAGIAFIAASVVGAMALPPETALVAEALLLVAYLGLLARGIASVRSSLIERTTWRSDDAGESRVALTFDDGPNAVWTPQVLDALRARNVKATFFLIGANVRRHPEIARRIVEEGHEVACHADTHDRMTPFFRPSRMERELRACLETIRTATGVTPRLYRPPFGIRSPAHAGVAARNDLRIIGMARRGRDTDPAVSAEDVATRTASLARGGEILALHDGVEPGRVAGTRAAAAAIPVILERLAAKGLTPVPASVLLSERPYRESPARPWSGRSRGGRFGNAFFAWTTRLLGPGTATVFLVPVAAWFVVASAEGRRASIDLRRRLHGKSNIAAEIWWAYRHFFVFGRTLLARLAYVRRGAKPPNVEYVGYESVKEVAEAPGGVLVVSAHVGDWISASRVFHRGGRELWIVAYKGVGLGSHQVQRDASDAPYRTIDVEESPVVVASQIASVLGQGNAVAVLGDRTLAGVGVPVEFVDGEAQFPTGVWTVAMLTGVPVIVVFAVPLDSSRTTVYVHGPVRVPRVPAGERAAALRTAVTQYAGYLEACVRRHPFHWANFYDFWGRP